jgi:hypothetical protein
MQDEHHSDFQFRAACATICGKFALTIATVISPTLHITPWDLFVSMQYEFDKAAHDNKPLLV